MEVGVYASSRRKTAEDKHLISARLRRVISTLDSAETSIRARAVRTVQSLPVFRAYKAQRQILLLKELAELFEGQQLDCYVVGGFALDGLQGKLTAHHADIDMALLQTDAEAAFSLLRQNGFRLETKSPYATAVRRDGLYVDLFRWKNIDQSTIQHISSDIVIRMPSAFLTTSQVVELMGVKYRIPSTEYLVSILPLTRKAGYIKFLESLVTSVPMEFRRATVQISIEATLHEFCGAAPLPSAGPGRFGKNAAL
jgi:aminoglycoside-2''-adenylyltransferase